MNEFLPKIIKQKGIFLNTHKAVVVYASPIANIPSKHSPLVVLLTKIYVLFQCQNERVWKLIDILKDNLTKQEMVGLLEDNSQFVPIGEQNILNSLSDSILFGKFKLYRIMFYWLYHIDNIHRILIQ